MLFQNGTELNVRDVSKLLQWNLLLKFKAVLYCHNSNIKHFKLDEIEEYNFGVSSIQIYFEQFFQAYELLKNFRTYCGLKRSISKVEEQLKTVQTIYKYYSEIEAKG